MQCSCLDSEHILKCSRAWWSSRQLLSTARHEKICRNNLRQLHSLDFAGCRGAIAIVLSVSILIAQPCYSCRSIGFCLELLGYEWMISRRCMTGSSLNLLVVSDCTVIITTLVKDPQHEVRQKWSHPREEVGEQ